MIRPRGKSFPRGQSAVPRRSLLTICWCIYSRFSIFSQLDMPRLQQSRKKNTHYHCLFFEKNVTRHVRRRFHKTNISQHCCGSMKTDATSHNIVDTAGQQCWVRLRGPLGSCETLLMDPESDNFRLK